MANDLYKGVNVSDGSVADPDDFNHAQRYLSARVFDQLIEKMTGSYNPNGTGDQEFPSQHGTDVSTAFAYALSVGGAHPRQGSTNNKVQIAAGTLLQKIAASDGGEPKLLAYTFAGTEEVAIANGDVANPRADLVQMKLEYELAPTVARDFEDATTRVKSSQAVSIERRVKCTLSVKAGAPAASPMLPAPDAGNVPICAVIVGTNYVAASGFAFDDAAGAVAQIHDHRMPLGVTPYHVSPTEMQYSANWTLSAGRDRLTAGAAASDIHARCPVAKGRIVAIAIATQNANGSDGHLGAYGAGGAGAIAILVANKGGMPDILDTDTNFKYQQITFQAWDFEAAQGPVVQSPGGVIPSPYNTPFWANGKRAQTEQFRIGGGIEASVFSRACLKISGPPPNGMVMWGVTFYVAEGL